MTSYPCPACLTEASLESGCPGCGRPPDPVAAEVIQLDTQIVELTAQAERARLAYADVSTQLQVARQRRARLAAQVWASARPAPVPPPTPAPAPVYVTAQAPARPEASTQTVKNVLFVLGGILIGIAAIVFTAFAWGTFGMAGKAAILAVVTGVALAVPLVAQRRGLRGTAETFAAIGLLLVILDGYSVWNVNLLGVHGFFSGWTYTGLVVAATASVSLGYAWLTRLSGPAVGGLLLAQPALPLLFVDVTDGRTGGFALVFATVAAGNLLAVGSLRRFAGRSLAVVLQILAWLGYAVSLLMAHAFAFVRLAVADPMGSAVAGVALLLLVGAVGVAAGPVARQRVLTVIGVAWFVLLLLLGQARIADLADSPHVLLWTSVCVLVLAGAYQLVRLASRAVAIGVLVGTAIGGGVAVLVAVFLTAWTGLVSIGLHESPAPYDWALPTSIALLTAAAVALVSPRWSAAIAIAAAGVVPLALAVPGRPPVDDWLPPAADLAAVAVLLATALVRRHLATRLIAGVGAFGLSVHAILAPFGEPPQPVWSIGAVLVLALATAVAARPGDRTPGEVALAAAPPLLVLLAAAYAYASDASDATVLHAAALAALTLPGFAWLLRPVPAYAVVLRWSAFGTVLVTVFAGVLAVSEDGWSKSLYVAFGLLALALLPRVPGTAVDSGQIRVLGRITPQDSTQNPDPALKPAAAGAAALKPTEAGAGRIGVDTVVGWAVLAIALLLARPPLGVLVESYRWLGEGWSSTPGGSGLAPGDGIAVGFGDVLAFAVLTLALGLQLGLRAAVSVAPVPAVLALVWLDVRWPGVPLIMLVAGLARIVRSGLRPARADFVVVPYAVIIAGSGLAGLSATSWSSILGLALVTAAFAVIGQRSAAAEVRWFAWPLAGIAWTGLAAVSAHAAHLPPRPTGLVVLAAAAVLVAVSYLPAWRGGKREVRALEPLAHAVAAVLLLSAYAQPNPAIHVAKVYLGWGLVVGATVLSKRNPVARAAVAAALELLALWSLLWAYDIKAVEAYSLPLALTAVAVGLLATRRDPSLSSWIGYGPALAAAFGPTLLAVLPGEGDPVRRVALGVAGLAVVIVGAIRRRQAPVVIGGGVLVVLALHELTLYWTRLPLWLPIGLGGAILLALAITYERRLRDLRVLRMKLASFR
ncbi:MAG: hypothetical protein HOU81_22130 [Hamadaea sp.]|uniref:SCO7613 C-terminal domain-containing membrane protein n=1 Tax=Hamadaea sp. TaxID=2024425 RepID=UPI0017F020CA|nr:hypothetical protein [Hamadaea sp.]NUR73527.1 hypothetical protein [Hamadaea sp.]NUT24184.1 hypothetical protein [Hamadaea sp.]